MNEMRSPRDVIDFWFVTHGPADWFGGSAAFDDALREAFAATHAHIALGEGGVWRTTPEGRLAEIIVLDQFSRQLFRDDGRAFTTDGMALVLAQEAVALDLDKAFETSRRQFFYTPFMHSESMVMQAQSVALYSAMGPDYDPKYALAHQAVIAKFGRFPKRNAALGRVSTPDELAYMSESDRMF